MHRISALLLGSLAIMLTVPGDQATAAQPEPDNARDQYFLGSSYSKGLGVTRDYAQAEQWYRRAAERGYAKAQTALGKLYDEGLGGRQDHAEALKWYRRAADQGEPEALFQVGYMHEIGRVVAQDRLEAWKWFSLAANRNYDDGRRYRDRLSRDFTAAQLRDAEARVRAWQPKPEPQG